MATKNPKVTSYLSPDVYDALVRHQKANQIGSLSGAITAILADHLRAEDKSGLSSADDSSASAPSSIPGVSSADDLSSKVEALIQEFGELQKRIASLESGANLPSTLSNARRTSPASGRSTQSASSAKSAVASKGKAAKAKPTAAASKGKAAKTKPTVGKPKVAKARPTATASKGKAAKARPTAAASKGKGAKARPTAAASKGKGAKAKAKSLAAATTGLTQGQLCKDVGINTKNVSKKARSQGVTSQQYMESVTGWTFRDGKYYPPA